MGDGRSTPCDVNAHRAYVHTYVHTYICAYLYICTVGGNDQCIHTYIHIYIHNRRHDGHHAVRSDHPAGRRRQVIPKTGGHAPTGCARGAGCGR